MKANFRDMIQPAKNDYINGFSGSDVRGNEKRNDFLRDIMHFGKRPAGDFGSYPAVSHVLLLRILFFTGFEREIMSFGKRSDGFDREMMSFGKRFDHRISPIDGRQFSDFNRDMLAFGKRDDFERSIMSFGRRRR
ncbi:unnamed protein product [Angiostrongylus costaricensis]|uniref:Orcokinin peptides type A n=1 Tax=Angiostrongylus costaricensis TaxID=334426 RepID=A0A0R3PVJ4_ANGCS|nr:unnamed protein product [Angiostrongylus costaricensis]